MKTKTEKRAFDHSGSSFESFLEAEGLREEVEAVAIKRVLAWQLLQEMRHQKKTKKTMAKELNTSRSQLERLLDPDNVSVSLETMTRAAHVLGKSLVIRISNRKAGSSGQPRSASVKKPARRRVATPKSKGGGSPLMAKDHFTPEDHCFKRV